MRVRPPSDAHPHCSTIPGHCQCPELAGTGWQIWRAVVYYRQGANGPKVLSTQKDGTLVGSDRHSARGTYLLTIRLAQPTAILVGRLGTFGFPAGWYAYAGSALGPGGLKARLARHLRATKRLHWHIDYLLLHGTVETIWLVALPDRLECAWADVILALPGAATPAPGFGASDCRCATHLAHFAHRPEDDLVAQALRDACPGTCDVIRRQPGCSGWSL